MLRLRSLFAFLTLGLTAWSQPPVGEPVLNQDQAQAQAAHFLAELIRIDTQDPPGNESRVAHYLQGVLQDAGIASEILEPVSGRASIVARLKGNGKQRPILLLGHEDVVPVDRARWTVDPFAATEREGVIWGRGATDDKAMVAANLEVFLQLKRMQIPLDRDVIFLSEASEEASSPAGMATIVERYWDKVDCEFALNEGGGSLLENAKVKYMGVATAEKLPRGAKLEATGSSGHGSVPRLDNAVVHLAAAVVKTGTWETPSRLNETTREFFRRLATISPPEEAAWYRNVLDPKVQAELRVKKPQYYSMLRTSVVPTMLKAGIGPNVIPSEAEATIDIRALPGEDMTAFFAEMTRVIGDPAVKIVPMFLERPAAPPSRLDTDMYRALERAGKRVYPGSTVLPGMLTAATDMAQLRAKGVQSYGIGPAMTEDDRTNYAWHSDVERLSESALYQFVEFTWNAVTEVAVKK